MKVVEGKQRVAPALANRPLDPSPSNKVLRSSLLRRAKSSSNCAGIPIAKALNTKGTNPGLHLMSQFYPLLGMVIERPPK